MDCTKCESRATHSCECLSTPMFFCKACLIEHISSYINFQHNIKELSSATQSQLCSECNFNFSELFCLCNRVGVCKVCLSSHISSPGTHYFDYIRTEKQSKDTSDVNTKSSSDNMKTEVMENIKQLEEFIEKLRNSKDVLVSALEKTIIELLSNAENCKKRLQQALDMIKSNRVPKEDQWPYTLKKRQGSMTPSRRTMSVSFKLCETELNIESVFKAIANIGKVALFGEVPNAQEQNLFFFKPRVRELASVEVNSFYVVKKVFPKNLSLPESGTWCEGPNKQIIFCGGYTNKGFSSEVFLIDPITLNFRQLPNMKSQRAMSAITFYNNEFFVFGGYNGNNLDTCEKFSFANNRWEELPNMPVPRSAFNIAQLGGVLYMTGDSKRLDAFNPETNTYLENEAVLTEASYSTLVTFKENLILVQNDAVFGIDLRNYSVRKIANAPMGKWWSCFPAFVNGNVLVFSRADDGYLWTFDASSATLTKRYKIIS